jgi:uncharacterized protein involved in exopolysaccharide biosynthesis
MKKPSALKLTTDRNQQLRPEKGAPFMPLLALIFRYRKLVILLVLIGAVGGGVFTKMRYKEFYLVKTTILLQPPRKVSDSKDYLGSAQTKDLLNNTYSAVLKSNDFIKSIVLADYDIGESGENKKQNLLAFFKTDNTGGVINELKGLIKINYDRKTNLLILEYTSTYPNIATQILNNTVSQLNSFYNSQFNSNSRRNLEFVEKNITSAKTELDEAKHNLAIFIERNKQLKVALKNKDQYPEYYQCIEAMEKLEEIANLKRKNYMSLVTKRESLKLEISENAPSVTVIEAASPPLQPIPGKYSRNIAIGALIGFLCAIAYIVLSNFTSVFNLDGTPIANIPTDLKNDFTKLLKPFGSKK